MANAFRSGANIYGAGAALGSFVPGVGTAVGGFVGGLLGAFTGGTVAGKATNAVLDIFVEDDAKRMVSIFEGQFKQLCKNYLVNEAEATAILDGMKCSLTGSKLKDIFASIDHRHYAKNLLQPH